MVRRACHVSARGCVGEEAIHARCASLLFAHLFEAVTPSELLELITVEGVEGEVELVEAVEHERREHPRQRDAVGRHRDLLQPERPQLAERRDDLGEVWSHRRLAASESDLGDARADEDAREPQHLLRRQQPCARRQIDAVLWHAVYASQRALFCE